MNVEARVTSMEVSIVSTPAAPRVALVSGFWGQNIGNAFFNIGGKWILDQVFGAENVAFVQDQPGYRTFHDASKGNPPNDVEFLKYLDLDFIVLQGPVMGEHVAKLWGPTLDVLAARGTRFILLGAAFFKFHERELAGARQFLERYRPVFISTRDSRSFDIIESWGTGIPLHDGIDSAFFAPKAFTPFRTKDIKYYAFNFDRYPEPSITFGRSSRSHELSFEIDDVVWNLDMPRVVSRLAHRSKVQAYLGHALDRRCLPADINGHKVVRPEHRFNPHMTYKIYQHPNAIASDEPWTYFTTYANAAMTLSDRVHACVATLAYGRPAMLFTPSPRSALFERLDCGAIKSRPVSLDLDYLEDQRQAELAWVQSRV